MEDYKFVVGQEFPDVKTFRKTIKEAAIAQHFELRLIKSDLIRYFARCASEGCPWRIRPVKLPNVPTFAVRSIDGTHTCGKKAQNGHQQASIDWIVSFIEERLRDNVNYKPKDILEDIRKQYGITIPYKQAWRAKERGLAAIYGSSEEGYSLLPAYCEQILRTNPGSIAQVFTFGTDNRFQSFFVSFYASIHGFIKGCAPLIGLSSIQLKSKYLGTLLCALSFDGDGGLFPLAFGIVDVENDESWMWFLSELHKLIEMNMGSIPHLTFLSDGQKGIRESVKTKFHSAYHGICIRYLTESASKEYKNPRLVHIISKAAYSITSAGFKERMLEIEEVSPEAVKWIKQFPPTQWAVAYLEGGRYGHLSSGIEEFNKWIYEARELPIIQVINRIHCRLINEFDIQRKKGFAWTSALVPTAENRMLENISKAASFQVLRSDEVEFEVLSADYRSDIVNIGTRSCSCRDWQLYGLPCSHGVAAILSCRKEVSVFSEKCFTVASYRLAYSEMLHPVPDQSEWNKVSAENITIVRPPKFRRPPGRPEKKRQCVEEDLNKGKHTVHCSKCNQTGHYKTTCKAEGMIQSITQC
ncbi:hypothetical protein ACHQM5_025238 [Ranunculus cassubicifolius]